MRNKLLYLFLLFLLNACSQKKETDIKESVNDTTPAVTGIGGIFFMSEQPAETQNWYKKNLGIVMDDYGAVFEFRNSNNANELNYLRWSILPEKSDYFKPSTKKFMINYRVRNIAGMLKNLKNNGVTILDSLQTYDYGSFIHILDSDGNIIELWEPIDSVLTKLGSKTNK